MIKNFTVILAGICFFNDYISRGQSLAGPNSPSVVVNVTYSGASWTTPGNAFSSNNTYTNATAGNIIIRSDWLRATGFGFSIPAGSVITGILVEVEIRHVDDDGVGGCLPGFGVSA